MEERLQKVLARIYGISRRRAEEWIMQGEVCVNGVVAQIGCKIDGKRDVVTMGSKRLSPKFLSAQRIPEVWMFYKPKGVACTHDDPFTPRTLNDFIPKSLKRKWMFVGRLDKESEGLLLLTNDGAFANKVVHPSSGIKKTYRIHVDSPFDASLIPSLKQGLQCQGEYLFFKEVRVVNSRKIDVTLSQGKKREIRRLLAAFNYDVLKLKRWKVGHLILDKQLTPGQSKRLSSREINLIFGTK
jgi:23S rRNA pseudouridine2605 synthase